MLSCKSHLTTGEVAAMYGVRVWQARRAADALGHEIPRAGLYRLIPRGLLGPLEEELKRRGWLPAETGAVHA
jgi:hypothetical protein